MPNWFDSDTTPTHVLIFGKALGPIHLKSFASPADSFQLGASQYSASRTKLSGAISWSSSNTGVATVNSSGLVTAVAAGSATITATDGTFSDTIEVNVYNAIPQDEPSVH